MPLLPKPVELPEWATSAVNVITPPVGKKTDGWVVTDVPPAEWQNWLHYWTEQWRAWAEAGLDDHETRITDLEAVHQVAISTWSFVENAAPFGRGNYIGAVGVSSGGNNNVDVRWPLHLDAGTVVKRLRANASDSGIGGTIRLVREALDGTKNIEITLPGFAPAFGFQEVIFDTTAVSLTEKWYIQMITPGAGVGTLEVRSLELDYL